MISSQNRSSETVLEQQSTAGDVTISAQRRLRAPYARQFQALPGHYSDRLLASSRSSLPSPDNTIDVCSTRPANKHASHRTGSRVPLGFEAEGISFLSACHFRRLLHGLRRSFLVPLLLHHQRRWRWRQILKLHVDREAITADLRDDRRGPRFSLWFRKRKQVVFAVLHNNTHASRPGQ